jgi:N-ethylmaleimide reductase
VLNGYLLDQFLQNGSNHRTDEYGGSPENRVLLLFQVLDAVLSVWSSDRVGIRISPATQFNGMSYSDPQFIFNYLASALNCYSLAWLHIIEPRISGNAEVKEGLQPVAAASLRELFTSRIIAAGGFDATEAEAILEKRRCGPCSIWPIVHRKSRLAPPLPEEPSVESLRPLHFSWRRCARLYRLPVF